MAHRNIPIFIPHLGCPHQCVFCNQHSISGHSEFSEAKVAVEIERALETIPAGTECEIAYFGGSFTGIDRALMIRLLELASEYALAGRVSGIRLSTRPDMINGEILSILRSYPVTTVELGLQSMDDRVLTAAGRGHTAQMGAAACEAVCAAGFALVGQMMLGLPQATKESELQTARFICRAGAAAARIYPTVVFYHTPLADMTAKGLYRPLTLREAADRGADVLQIFQKAGVPCLRIGLCATEELVSPEAVSAGPNHPALGELIWNEFYYRELCRLLSDKGLTGQAVELTVYDRELSKVIGQRRCNLERLWKETGTRVERLHRVREIGVLSVTEFDAEV